MVKVFIVEDEFIMRERMVKKIDWASIGCQVVGQAENGLDALKVLEYDLPDIIITDLKMPKMDGLEFAQKIKNKYKNTKVLIMTGHSDFFYTKKAIQIGVQDYILKPADKEEILECVSRVANTILDERKSKNEMEDSDTNSNKENEAISTKKQIVEAIEYINQNYYHDNISLTKVAETIHVHPVYLGRLFRKELGQNFSDIVLRVRIENAKILLKDVGKKTYEIATNVGISDPHYFSQVFKKYTGVTPTEYREMQIK